MTSNFLIVYGLLIHFFADFAMQTHEQATLKSTSEKFLFYHVGVYSLIWLVAMFPILGPKALSFAVITFFCHFVTDWWTSKINKKFFDKQDYHNAFVGIGFDQVLHYLQLFYTYKFLTTWTEL